MPGGVNLWNLGAVGCYWCVARLVEKMLCHLKDLAFLCFLIKRTRQLKEDCRTVVTQGEACCGVFQ